WPAIEQSLGEQLSELKMGPVDDFSNFINAVIDRKAYQSITSYIEEVKQTGSAQILFGGNHSDAEGYFIEPTVLLVDDPQHRTMCEEIFGPVVSVFLYDDARYDETLTMIDETSPYALTGAVFARERRVIAETIERLADNAGNFYINDKPTG